MPHSELESQYHEAVALFTRVSSDYPASVVGQSAAIAWEVYDQPDLLRVLKKEKIQNIRDMYETYKHDDPAYQRYCEGVLQVHEREKE